MVINQRGKKMTICLLRLCQIDPPRSPCLSAMVSLVRNASLRFGFASQNPNTVRVNKTEIFYTGAVFESLLGNESVKIYLRKAVALNRVPHALLFSGIDGIGKSLFAKELATHLLQSNKERVDSASHPDLHILRPEGKGALHSIEALREMTHAMQQMPFEAKAKVFLIYDAHRMQPVQANAILK